MTLTAVDTNVIVAALLSWHDRHDDAAARLEELLGEPGRLVVPGHALLEAYSVMTRLPAGKRVTSAVAEEALRKSFRTAARVSCLDTSGVWGLLQRLGGSVLLGGAAYDARVLAEAEAAGAARLITANVRHFTRFETELEIVAL